MSESKKITQLNEITTAQDVDILPIVDDSEPDTSLKTKRITKANLLKEVTERLTTLEDNETEDDTALSDHIADTENPHSVTKDQVGLGSVDNTSDADKPISDATAVALANKADAVHTHTALDVGGANEVSATEIRSHIDDENNPHGVTKAQIGLGNVTNEAQIPLTQKASPNGVATLDASGKIPTSQLPALAITDTFVCLDEAEMLALDAETGDVAVRVDEGKSYILRGTDPSVLADWQELLTPTDSVLSVNGQTGAITLTTSDISEGTNQYFTNERAVDALNGQNISLFVNDQGYLVSGDNISNLTNDAGYITSSALSSYQPLDGDLTAIAALGSTGIAVRTATNTWAQRTITGTTNQVTVTNGNGVSGNPTLSLPQNIHTAATPTFAAMLLHNGNSGYRVYNTQITPGASAGNWVEIGNLNVSTGTGFVEIYLSGVQGGNVQGLKYLIPCAFNATNGVWQSVVPVSTQSSYNETIALEFNLSGSGPAYFRVRTISSTSVLNCTVITHGYSSNTWTFTSATGTGASFNAFYASSVIYQKGGYVSLRGQRKITYGTEGTNPATEVGWQMGSDASIDIGAGSFVNDIFKTIPITKTVPTSGNALDIMTLSNTDFSSIIEVTMNIHRGSFAQTKKYTIPLAYGGTGGAWHKILPIYTSGPYSGNDVDLEVNITTSTATIRMRRVSGATDPTTAYFTVISTGDARNTAVTVLSGSPYAASAPTVVYSPTSISQLNGFTGAGTDNPTCAMDIVGDKMRLRSAKTPANASDTGNQGDIAWDTSYVYVCTATNTWKRSALATW